jgi:hypothetical protein
VRRWDIEPWDDGYVGAVLGITKEVFAAEGRGFRADAKAFREGLLHDPRFTPDGATVAKDGSARDLLLGRVQGEGFDRLEAE